MIRKERRKLPQNLGKFHWNFQIFLKSSIFELKARTVRECTEEFHHSFLLDLYAFSQFQKVFLYSKNQNEQTKDTLYQFRRFGFT